VQALFACVPLVGCSTVACHTALSLACSVCVRGPAGLFGDDSRVKPAGVTFGRMRQLLEQSDLFEGGTLSLGCKTLIAPSDDVSAPQQVTNMLAC